MAKALEGIRVLDATIWLQGPLCSQYLADFGAEVIHVERPVTGDQARGVRSIKAVPVASWNQYFLNTNRNKKSMAIDLKNEAGRDLMYELVAKSDVFLWNQTMSALPGLGLTYEKLSEINPGLIYATNSGYGHAGEFEKPAYDMTVQALTGIMSRLGEPDQPPIYLGLGVGDAYGGLMAALGILLALQERRRTGKGQHIDGSLYGAQLFLAAPTLQHFLAHGNTLHANQQPRASAGNPLWNRYEASDGWLFVCQENTDAGFAAVCDALDAAALRDDARFATPALRSGENEALVAALDAVFATNTAAEWTERLRKAGIAASPIHAFKDVAVDEQAWANDYHVKAHCNEIGEEVELRGNPVTLSKTPASVETLGPELGQDTEILLMEILGLEWERIEELKAAGAIP